MFCSRKSKLKLENIHKRISRVAFNEYGKNYKNLLSDLDSSEHVEFLANEVLKLTNQLNPQFMWCFSRTIRFLKI